MSEPLERDKVIDLLDRLGSEQDEEVLAAARALHSQITGAGMGWHDLLVRDEGPAQSAQEIDDDTDEEEEFVSGDTEDEADTSEPAVNFSYDESKTSALIDKLLAREGSSEMLREELEEYKSELANGVLESSDHRYIQALYARLSQTD